MILIACVSINEVSITEIPKSSTPIAQPAIIPIQNVLSFIELSGQITDPKAELSGLGWYGDTLILLPQYPHRFDDKDGAFFAIPKQEILDYINGNNLNPIEPRLVHLNAPGLKKSIENFQGYEAIAFHGDQVFLTIEAGKSDNMHAYLVSGIIKDDLSEINLDSTHIVEIPLPIQSKGRTYEALMIVNNTILTFFEINNDTAPAAQVFDLNLNLLGTMPFPILNHRLTDAAIIDTNSFWVINQMTSNNPEDQVEQLIKMNYSPDGITLADIPAIQLKVDSQNSYKWEGLALLDNLGFLLVTDKEPSTILAFMNMP